MQASVEELDDSQQNAMRDSVDNLKFGSYKLAGFHDQGGYTH